MFSEALLAADEYYYKSRYNPRKKKQKDKDKLSGKIKKFSHTEEEKWQKQRDLQKMRQDFIAVHGPKTLSRTQKTLKEIKSTNNSVIEDGVDKIETAVTRNGHDQFYQDDYSCVSHGASAFHEKMLEKCSNLSEKPKFPTKSSAVIKELNSTREILKHGMCYKNVNVSYKRGCNEYDRIDNEKDLSSQQKYEPYEKVRDKKPKMPKEKKLLTSQMDFRQLLILAEKNKSEPTDITAKKKVMQPEQDTVITKKQNIEYDEEMARRKGRQEKMVAEKSGHGIVLKYDKSEKERKLEVSAIGRVRKLSDKYHFEHLHYQVKSNEKEHVSHGVSVCKVLSQRNYSGDKLSKINQNTHIGHESLKK